MVGVEAEMHELAIAESLVEAVQAGPVGKPSVRSDCRWEDSPA